MSTIQNPNMTGEELDIIIAAAKAAAVMASQAKFEAMGYVDGGTCGFGWTVIRGIKMNTKIGKLFKSRGLTKSYGETDITLWSPGQYTGQNIDVHEAGADACAEVFEAAGFESYGRSRAD